MIVAASIIIAAIVGLGSGFTISSASAAIAQKKDNITLTAIFNQLSNTHGIGKILIEYASEELKARHPNIDIKLKYTEYPYNQTRIQMLNTITNQTPVDLVSIDQIWLGEFAQKGLLTDLSNRTQSWDRQKDWYEENWDGGKYKERVYGIWAWTDVRGIWYWRDLLNEAGVDPNMLKTWDGYIAAAKKLNSVLGPKKIEGVHLTGASHSPDLWYPYLWMLGGDIVQLREGHPTKGAYWFPAYNSSKGVSATNFIAEQIKAGIKPQKNHFWGKEFADRKFAVMIEGSWVPTAFKEKQELQKQQQQKLKNLEQSVGFIPMFPVPTLANKTSTLMGGWELSIPSTSTHKDLAWELITLMVKPKILASWLGQVDFLPTQIPIGEGLILNRTSSNPYYDQMISLIPFGGSRPNIPEYPQIAENIRQAIDDVYYGIKEPKQALDDAAAKSAVALGW
jgi:multiple sugar transport system substrate-binding protein